MQDAKANLLTRDDTFFGVCQGLGEDLGVSPTWFRLGFALALFFSPLGALAAYAAAGLLVFVTRWLAPGASEAPAAPAEAQQPAAENDSAPLAAAA